MVESETPAYENPLIPNARLRQIYLAMLRAQMLEKALPAARRTRAVAAVSQGYATGIAGLEACLASTSVDLGPHDLVSDALAGGVLDFLRGAAVQRDRPELIVLDPPRAGAGAEACELLLRVAAPQMVYVSCDPATLTRDLAALQPSYRIAALHLVDLFPQTEHLETVVVLERNS